MLPEATSNCMQISSSDTFFRFAAGISPEEDFKQNINCLALTEKNMWCRKQEPVNAHKVCTLGKLSVKTLLRGRQFSPIHLKRLN